MEELTACLETNTDPLLELDKVEGDDFPKLLKSLLDCNSEEPGDDVGPAVAEKALEVAEGTVLSYW